MLLTWYQDASLQEIIVPAKTSTPIQFQITSSARPPPVRFTVFNSTTRRKIQLQTNKPLIVQPLLEKKKVLIKIPPRRKYGADRKQLLLH